MDKGLCQHFGTILGHNEPKRLNLPVQSRFEFVAILFVGENIDGEVDDFRKSFEGSVGFVDQFRISQVVR